MLRVACTDPLSVIDIPHLVRQTGDTLLSKRTHGEVHTFVIQKT